MGERMKILYIGGTGEISFSCVLESLALGHDVSVFNRGQTEQPLPAAVRQIAGDLADDAGYARLGEQRFDVVCQFFGYDVARIEKDLQTFAGRTGQYVFISTASAYSKPIEVGDSNDRSARAFMKSTRSRRVVPVPSGETPSRSAGRFNRFTQNVV